MTLSNLLNLSNPTVLICERITSITEAVLRVESVCKSTKYHSEPVHRKSPGNGGYLSLETSGTYILTLGKWPQKSMAYGNL